MDWHKIGSIGYRTNVWGPSKASRSIQKCSRGSDLVGTSRKGQKGGYKAESLLTRGEFVQQREKGSFCKYTSQYELEV